MRIRRKYTLVEIMAVMVVASILISIGIPAFRKMMGGGGVDFSASQLKIYIEQAQNMAVADRKKVALLFDYKGENGDGVRQMVRPCYLKQDAVGVEFDSWIPGHDWKPVMDNTLVIRYTRPKKVNEDNAGNADEMKDFREHAGLSASKYDIDYFRFEDSGDSKKLLLIENVPDIRNNKSEYPAVVFSQYGALDRLPNVYFVISEGALADGKFIHKGTVDGKIVNYKVLSVNRFTGKVEYL